MLKNDDKNSSPSELSRQAAVWYLLLRDPHWVSLRVACQFLGWLMRSADHVRELILISRQDALLMRMMQTKRERSNVTHVNWWQGSMLKPTATHTRRHVAGWTIAATVLLVLPVAAVLVTLCVGTPERTLATATNGSNAWQLEDGSRVALDAGSKILVNFTDAQRNVHLYQGSALFDVAPETDRPFVVNTFLVDIAAVDSRFVVKIDTSVEVSVSQGAVEVSRRGTKVGAPMIKVRQGHSYRVPVNEFQAIVAEDRTASRPALVDG